MSEIPAEVTPAQTNVTQTAEGTAQPNPEYVSKKDVAKIVANSIDAAFRRRDEEAQAKTQEQASPSQETLTARLTRIEAERKAEQEEVKRDRRDNAIQSAINSYGLDTDNAELLHDHLAQRFGDRIKVDGKSVYVEDDEAPEGKADIKTFIGKILKAKGDKFRPAVQAPSSRGLQPSRGNGQQGRKTAYMDLSPEERSKMTPAQRNQAAMTDWKNR